MALNISKEVAAMKRMTVDQLRERYAEVFGERTGGRSKPWLIKRIAWRMQANEEGDLSERARRRAAELANDSDLRMTPPKTTKKKAAKPAAERDDGLMVGSTITRIYKGEKIEVLVLADGFEYEGEVYKSLSAVAKAVTGSHWSGRRFFGLQQKAGKK